MALVDLLGDTLVKNDGTELKTDELSSKEGAVIGLYFSAHWCPPCRGFTPKLATVYNEIKSAGNDFEIVFISWDSDEDGFKSYHAEMPWLGVPYGSKEKKDACSKKFEVDGIPMLVLLDAVSGDVIKSEGRDAIDTHGAAGFPFTAARLKECEKEKGEKKTKALKELGLCKFLEPLITLEQKETEIDLETATQSSEVLALAFMKGCDCQGSNVVLPKLITIQETLGKSKLNVVIIPLEDMAEFDDEMKTKMNNIPMVQFGERSKEIVKKFETVLSEIDTPHVFVIAKDDESSFKIHAENAARDIYYVGAEGFPWSKEALDALKAKEEALKADMKSKQKDLQFFATGEQSHIVDKNGEIVSLVTLQSKDVVGIYFSAHWCPPCRMFTPQLAELYKKCQDAGKSFEIVFVSSDRDKAAFDEYYAEMPWCALSYDERSLKGALSDTFDVQGIPTFVLLTGKGEMITSQGRAAVQYGVDYFPWGDEDMARGKSEEVEKARLAIENAKEAENKIILEQEEAKKIVIRRHIGNPKDVKLSVDHNIEFESFSTVSAPSAVVPSGKKAWYEVTFKEGDGISQIGWATSKFESADQYKGDGVGDCSNSYGFDGQRTCKWHSGSHSWGKQFDPNGDRVLGVAADLENGKILFGVDGDWSEPMGVAFEGIDKDIGLFPALTASTIKVFVNFGDSDFKYGPPDPSFEKLKDVLENKEE